MSPRRRTCPAIIFHHEDPFILLEDDKIGSVEGGDEGHRARIGVLRYRNRLVDMIVL